MEWFPQTDQAPMDDEDWEGMEDTPWEQPQEMGEGGWGKTWEEEQEAILMAFFPPLRNALSAKREEKRKNIWKYSGLLLL